MSGLLPFRSAVPYRRAEMPPGQIEFALNVPICAWCRPVQHGDSMGVWSHGICPRHFRSLQWQMKGIVPKRRARSRGHTSPDEALLPL